MSFNVKHCHHLYLLINRDVHIGLVGYGDKMKWPKHYTVNGNLNIDSDVKNMKFEKTDPIITLQVIYIYLIK